MHTFSLFPRRGATAIAALFVALMLFNARADIDKKYFSKIAKEVWAQELPQFNPKADLSDSLFQNRSANYIARYINATAKYDNGPNQNKYRLTGISNSNSINLRLLQRDMVKLNDMNAVEHFSEFTINVPQKEDVRGFDLFTLKPAFGARIHKPDGSVVEADLNEVLTDKKGKKNKEDEKYKIAIAGLEVGDVLEFFYLDEYMAEEQHVGPIKENIISSYPTKNYLYECEIAPQIAFEYNVYNGAPNFTMDGTTDKGLKKCSIQLENIDAVEESMPFFAPARQVPYVVFNLLNPTARFEPQLSTSRPGGMRKMIYPYLSQDIAATIKICKLPPKVDGIALGMVKGWLKTHPEATERETADAAWMAIRLAARHEDTNLSDRQYCILFHDIAEKLNLPTPVRVAVTSSRKSFPVTELSSYRQADYIAMMGDVTYIPMSTPLPPGEIPGDHTGETAIKYNASPRNERLHTTAEVITLEQSKPKDHYTDEVLTVKIDPENEENLAVSHISKRKGSMKYSVLNVFSDTDWESEYTRYLGAKPRKNKNKPDEELLKSLREEAADLITESLWGTKARVDSVRMLHPGFTPDQPEAVYKLAGSVPGLISQAGNGLMVNLGKLYGSQQEVKGNQRKREIAVVNSAAHRMRHQIHFEIPEGYMVAPESLEAFNKKEIVPDASFFSEAAIEGNNVVIKVLERYNRAIYPAESWPDILKVMDASVDFCSASILLQPKQ